MRRSAGSIGGSLGRRGLRGSLHAMFAVLLLGCALAAVSSVGRPAHGAVSVPDGFTRSHVAGGLRDPTAMAFAPDGRIFVTEQGGDLRVIENGELLAEPFASLPVDSRKERGLLGVALDPDFVTNGYVYVYHTTATDPVHNRIVRFTADPGDPDVAAPGSYTRIFDLDKLSAKQSHNGGAVHFGVDGKLYVAVGDNGSRFREENAQTLDTLFGKMLRLNKDGSIPEDNPFYGRTRGKNRAIWARGLRNPYSFAVRPDTGAIFINDVGLHTWEEINRGAPGVNFGWPRYEGPESSGRFRPPIFAYRHDGDPDTTGCAITGGTFYVPGVATFPPGYVGDYFFADFCSGWIRRYDPATDRASSFASGLSFPVDLQVGPDANLYYLERGTGSVGRISYIP